LEDDSDRALDLVMETLSKVIVLVWLTGGRPDDHWDQFMRHDEAGADDLPRV
jgi:hypothetical protein